MQAQLEQLSASFSYGKIVHEGLTLAIVGRPNVGKSSIFNKLVAYERAIVTDLPGTTRDSLTEAIDIRGIPIVLTDTAGLRRSEDKIESLGVERSKRYAAEADLVLLVIDGSDYLKPEYRELLTQVDWPSRVVALNKLDLPSFASDLQRGNGSSLSNGNRVVSVSAKTSAGLDDLCTAIVEPFISGAAGADGLMITNARHHDLLCRALDGIRSSKQLLEQGASEEIVLVGLHNALRYLGEILGETTTDDILAEIFSTFCVGK